MTSVIIRIYESRDMSADSYCPSCRRKLRLGHDDVLCDQCGRTWTVLVDKRPRVIP